ncbi:MAG: preprotein translocase subunit SecG [Verrucomicrobia bacterium]|nr:preprotein translocase subunit SecG [Verrucomicrobiota bacterium]MBU1910221.1 preprotein translocase subunit SecG [Verrucomicrobiota bacterium]
MLTKIILIGVEMICSLALIGLILLQQSKSGGLGLAFGAGMGESLFGSRAGNILTKLTIIFAVVFMVNTVLLALVYSGEHTQSLMSSQMRPPAAPSGPITGPVPSAPMPSGVSMQEIPMEQPAAPVEPAAPPPKIESEPVPVAE